MFKLSERSVNNLKGVHPDLITVVRRAIEITEIDFGVIEGVRTLEEQKELVKEGVSWTLDSYHLIQPLTDFSHAVDLMAYYRNKASWEMKHYGKIAEAMLAASKEKGVPLVWGGVWDRELDQLNLQYGLVDDIDQYVARFKAKHGRRPHLDGPHFQLSESVYKRK